MAATVWGFPLSREWRGEKAGRAGRESGNGGERKREWRGEKGGNEGEESGNEGERERE